MSGRSAPGNCISPSRACVLQGCPRRAEPARAQARPATAQASGATSPRSTRRPAQRAPSPPERSGLACFVVTPLIPTPCFRVPFQSLLDLLALREFLGPRTIPQARPKPESFVFPGGNLLLKRHQTVPNPFPSTHHVFCPHAAFVFHHWSAKSLAASGSSTTPWRGSGDSSPDTACGFFGRSQERKPSRRSTAPARGAPELDGREYSGRRLVRRSLPDVPDRHRVRQRAVAQFYRFFTTSDVCHRAAQRTHTMYEAADRIARAGGCGCGPQRAPDRDAAAGGLASRQCWHKKVVFSTAEKNHLCAGVGWGVRRLLRGADFILQCIMPCRNASDRP